MAGGRVPRRFAGCPKKDSVAAMNLWQVGDPYKYIEIKIRLCPWPVAGRHGPRPSLSGIPHTPIHSNMYLSTSNLDLCRCKSPIYSSSFAQGLQAGSTFADFPLLAIHHGPFVLVNLLIPHTWPPLPACRPLFKSLKASTGPGPPGTSFNLFYLSKAVFWSRTQENHKVNSPRFTSASGCPVTFVPKRDTRPKQQLFSVPPSALLAFASPRLPRHSLTCSSQFALDWPADDKPFRPLGASTAFSGPESLRQRPKANRVPTSIDSTPRVTGHVLNEPTQLLGISLHGLSPLNTCSWMHRSTLAAQTSLKPAQTTFVYRLLAFALADNQFPYYSFPAYPPNDVRIRCPLAVTTKPPAGSSDPALS